MTLALRTLWALMWRSMPLAFIAGIVIGAVIGATAAIIGVDIQSQGFKITTQLAGVAVGFAASVWIMRRLMTKGFGRYKLLVVEQDVE